MSGSNKWGLRPEHQTEGNGAKFYDESESERYNSTQTTNIIQKDLTEKALELLGIALSSPEEAPPGTAPTTATTAVPPLIADIGCGSGLSGRVLSERGLPWVGTDISPSMLRLAAARPDCAGRLALADMMHGLPLRTATFDAAVSISAVQWLCVAPRPAEAAAAFFAALARVLTPAGRAALQVYLENDAQKDLLLEAAAAAGLAAIYAMDFPHRSTAKKYYILAATKSSMKEIEGGGLAQRWAGLRCNLAWPAEACCSLPWLGWLGGESGGDAARAAASGARARQEHAAVAKRALRLLRHAAAGAAGGAAPPPMPAAQGDLVVVEAAVTEQQQPRLMPCSGPFVAHIHAGSQYLEDAQLDTDGESRRAALAALTGCSPDAAAAATVSMTTKSGASGGEGGWTGCLAAVAAAADGEPSAKAPFFFLEPLGAGALALLHATKPVMPQLLVLPSAHAGRPGTTRRWEGLAAVQGRLETWCRQRGACVVGVDAVLDPEGLSCAWLVYWHGLQGADRSALAQDWVLS